MCIRKEIHALIGARVNAKIVELTRCRLAMLLGEECLRRNTLMTRANHILFGSRLRTRKGEKGVSEGVKMVGS